MNNPIKTVYQQTREVLHKKNYLLLFLLITFLMFSLYIILPVLTTPGNTISFQLSILRLKDYFVLIPLSLLISLMISMQVYSYKKTKSMKGAGRGAVGSSSGIVAGIFGTASCSSCIAALFGFLGTGGILFLIKYQWYVVALSTFLVLLSLYLTSAHIEKNCEVCQK